MLDCILLGQSLEAHATAASHYVGPFTATVASVGKRHSREFGVLSVPAATAG